MNVIYNSANYYIVDYPEQQHSYEVVDKSLARSAFLQGDAAETFGRDLIAVLETEGVTADDVDDMINAAPIQLLNTTTLH